MFAQTVAYKDMAPIKDKVMYKSKFHKQHHHVVPAKWNRCATANPFEAAMRTPQRRAKYYKAMVELMRRHSSEKGK